MLYSWHRQLTPPTCINLSLKCNFTDPSKLDLIVVKGNLLCIYRIYTLQDDGLPTAKFELLSEFVLQGLVTSISSCRTIGNSLDSLLLSFNDAKMSLVEYSVFTQNLVTVSMHNYEREELKKDVAYKGTPTVRVDHQNRCAVLRFYQQYFSILPFKYDTGITMEEDEEKRDHPFLPSYVINENEIDPDIRNVLDFSFLYGYLEPTLAILYERHQTFVGRLAQRKDTVSLIVVSFDIFQKTYPILYKVDGLPYNSTHIEAVPSPVGGVMIFSHNAVIHVDQTHTPGFACLVNPFFDMESHFKAIPDPEGNPVIPVKNKPVSVYIKTGKFSNCKELGISLDGSRSTFLSPDIVLLILRSGEMLQVDLIGDDNAGRSWNRKRGGVKDIQIKKLGLTTSAPSCITLLADLTNFLKPQILSRIAIVNDVRNYSNYFFVGSLVSDAMLIQYFQPIEEKQAETEIELDGEDELDEELYGGSKMPKEKENTAELLDQFKFRICDNILVTGPLRNLAVGIPAPSSTHEYSGEPVGEHLEVVACGGNEMHGSLLVMHESVRPHIVSSFPLGDADDIWSVRVSNDPSQAGKEQFHKFLVISRGTGTSILSTGEELEELEKSGFYVEGPTVSVGTALHESIVVQIYPNGVVLLSPDAVRLSDTPIGDEDVWIVSCFINDPYIVVLLNTGELQLFLISSPNEPISFERELKLEIPIACICLYTDDSPIQHLQLVKEVKLSNPTMNEENHSKSLNGSSKPKNSRMDVDVDDLDDLYGDSVVEMEEDEPEQNLFEQEDQTEKVIDIDQEKKRTALVTHWCFVVDDSGTLRIYSLPDLVEKFVYYDFRLAPRFVYDHVIMPEELEKGNYPILIEELAVVNLGSDPHRYYPYVVARTHKSDVFIYRIIPSIEHTPGTNGDRLSLRMVRIDYSSISRESQNYADNEGDKLNPIDSKSKPPNFIKKTHLIPFDKIGVEAEQLYAGLVVTGTRPLWIMMAHSGVRKGLEFFDNTGSGERTIPSARMNSSNAIRVHPMHVDGPLLAFAPIHNVNITFGFAYINQKGQFRICQLPPHFSYDRDWPVCKVPLGRSAQKISYHPVSQTYLLASSTPSVFQIDKAQYMAAIAAGVIKDGEELPEAEKKVSGIMDVIEVREPGMYLPEISFYQLELISPVTWETVDIIKMSEFEQILTVKVVELASKENTSGRKVYVAVGTGFLRSEELSCRGRLLVYDIIDVVPEPGRPQTNHKLKPYFTSDEKTPVTALTDCNGYLLAAVGTKIIMYAMEDEGLNGIAFLDVSFLVVSISAVKNFILISDAFKSVWFVVFQEEPPKIILLGKDLYPVQVFGSEFMIGGNELAMLVSDNKKNLHVMSYEPFSVQSLGGLRLLRRGEMNLGSEIQAFASIRLKSGKSDQKLDMFGVVAGTAAGGLSMIIPVAEKMYKRLYGLYSRMVTHLEHHAGLNPRGFRQIVLPIKSIHASSVITGPPGPRGILDGDLLFRFLHLSLVQQRELAKAIGSRDDRIIDDLLEISTSLEYF